MGFSRAFRVEKKKKKKKADGEKKPPTRPAPTRPPPRSAPRGARGRAAVAVPARRCRPTPPAAAPREAAAELGLPPALRATRSSRDGAPHCLPALRAKSFSRPESPVFFFFCLKPPPPRPFAIELCEKPPFKHCEAAMRSPFSPSPWVLPNGERCSQRAQIC